MKYLKFFLLSCFFISCFAACTGRKYVNDIEAGTPTHADSALVPTKDHHFDLKEIEEYQETLPKVYRR